MYYTKITKKQAWHTHDINNKGYNINASVQDMESPGHYQLRYQSYTIILQSINVSMRLHMAKIGLFNYSIKAWLYHMFLMMVLHASLDLTSPTLNAVMLK